MSVAGTVERDESKCESEYEAQGHGKSKGGELGQAQRDPHDHAGNFTQTTPGETVNRCARGKSDPPILHGMRRIGLRL